MTTPTDQTYLIQWPSTASVLDAALESLQQEAGFSDDGAVLTEQEAQEQAPDILEIINSAINAYTISDILAQFVDDAQTDIVRTVLDNLSEDHKQRLTNAIDRAFQEDPD